MGEVSDFFADIQFEDVIDGLIDGGWYDFLFPFLLVYAIVFTILNKADIFSGNKAVRVLIAAIFGLFAVAFPISDEGYTLGEFMMVLFPGVTAFTIGVLALYIVTAMLGVDLMDILGNKNSDNQLMKYILGGLGVIVVVYYYAKGFGWLGLDDDFWLWRLLEDPFLYVLLAFVGLFWWVSKDDGDTISRAESAKKKEEAKIAAIEKEAAERRAKL